MIRNTKVTFFLIFLTHYNYANFRVVDFNSGSIASQKRTTARIEKEYVKIKLFRDTCRVHCKFWVSSKERNEDLTIAFPIKLGRGINNEDITNHGMTDFSAIVDGNEVKHEKWNDTIDGLGKFRNSLWYKFKLTIKKDSIHTISCSFKDKWAEQYMYFIGSATTWAKNIGQGTVVFDHSEICSNNFVYKSNIYKEEMYPYLSMNIKPKQYKDSLVFKFEDYLPDTAEMVKISVFPFWNKEEFYKRFESPTNDAYKKLYSWKNIFLFEFLGNTSSFSHKYDFESIRDEISERIQKNKPSSKPTKYEKDALKFLSVNLDSLKTRIRKGKELTGKVSLEKLELGSEPLGENIKIHMKNTVESINNKMHLLVPLYMNKINGKLTVSFQINGQGYVESLQYKGNGISKEEIETVLGLIHINNKSTFRTFPFENKKVTMYINIEIKKKDEKEK